MNLNDHLIDTFSYNDYANRRILKKISALPDRSECVKIFSHLINSQYKWMARIRQDPKSPGMDWWDPLYSLENLEPEWEKSLQPWLEYLRGKNEVELCTEIQFSGFDGGRWAAKPKDIALQLNYHSIHHRALMQSIIRKQGREPDFLDYIGTVYRKVD